MDILLNPHLLKHSPSPISSLFGQLPAPGLQETSSSITVHTCQCPGPSWLSARSSEFSQLQRNFPQALLSKPPLYLTRLISITYLVLKFIQIFLYFKMFCFFFLLSSPITPSCFLIEGGSLSLLPRRVISNST